MNVTELAMREAGTLRDAREFVLCGAEPCDDPARIEVLHSPGNDPAATWVPLCNGHWATTCAGRRIEYIVEIHGFVPGSDQ